MRRQEEIESKMEGGTRKLGDLLAGWQFSSLAIFTLVFFFGFMVVLLAVPPGESGVGAFARDFRTWCFNYDPATGEMDWFYVTVMLVNPLGLAVLVGLIWRDQLVEAFATKRAGLMRSAGVALGLIAMVGVGFIFVGQPSEYDGDYPFPAERIRTEIDPPVFELEDHTGELVSLEQFRGEVVVVTAVYATCGASCPIILTELKRVTDQLTDAQRDQLTVIGITLDPEKDGPEELTALADRHRVEAPLYRLLHGDPDEVNRVLDEFSISRIPDEERGEIDHANLFFVIDQEGKIAYRIGLGDRTENWLLSALRFLIGDDTGEEIAQREPL